MAENNNIINNEAVKDVIEETGEQIVKKARQFDLVSALEGSAATAALIGIGVYVKKKVCGDMNELKETVNEKTKEARRKKLEKIVENGDAAKAELAELDKPEEDPEVKEETGKKKTK